MLAKILGLAVIYEVHTTPEAEQIAGLEGVTIGDTIYLSVYYADREVGDSAKYRIMKPDQSFWPLICG